MKSWQYPDNNYIKDQQWSRYENSQDQYNAMNAHIEENLMVS